MNAEEKDNFIRFLAQQVKKYCREVMAYELLLHILKQEGYDGVSELLHQVQKNPVIDKRLAKNFESLEQLLPQPNPAIQDWAKEFLDGWNPTAGQPN